MSPALASGARRLNRALHRDAGYFLTTFVISYCLSGLALNHMDDWNPDFVIHRREVALDRVYREDEVQGPLAQTLAAQVGERTHRFIDVPTEGQVKIYYDNASLHLYLNEKRGAYERVSRRPLFYDANALHRNSLRTWRLVSDLFSILLILVNVTGLFVLKGRHGLRARGKWLVAAGAMAAPRRSRRVQNDVRPSHSPKSLSTRLMMEVKPEGLSPLENGILRARWQIQRGCRQASLGKRVPQMAECLDALRHVGPVSRTMDARDRSPPSPGCFRGRPRVVRRVSSLPGVVRHELAARLLADGGRSLRGR
jgi:hypothetical protein